MAVTTLFTRYRRGEGAKTIMEQMPGWWIEQIERYARELGYPDGPRGLPRHQVFMAAVDVEASARWWR